MAKYNKKDAWKKVRTALQPVNSSVHSEYADNWAGFIRDILAQRLHKQLTDVIQSVHDYEITLVPSATGVGKSWLAAYVAVSFFKTIELSQTYLMAAPPFSNLEMNIMAKIHTAIIDNEPLFKDDRVIGTKITRRPEEFIAGLTIPQSADAKVLETRFSGKHAPNMLVILDEGDAIPDAIYNAIEGWSSGGLFRMLILYNPKRHEGKAWEMYKNKTANIVRLTAFDHPNVITGKNLFPGAVTRDKIVRRINESCYHESEVDENEKNVLDNFELPEFLIGCIGESAAKKQYPPLRKGTYYVDKKYPEFVYKVLARYPGGSTSRSIPESWIQGAVTRWKEYTQDNLDNGRDALHPPPLSSLTAGGDVGDTGNDPSVVCIRHDKFVAEFRKEIGLSDASDVADWFTTLYNETNPDNFYVDSNGVGAGVPGAMQKSGCKNVIGVVAHSASISTEEGRFDRLRDEMLWQLRSFLHPNNKAAIPENENLLRQLRTLTHQEIGGKIRFIKKREMKKQLDNNSPDEMEALMLSLGFSRTSIGGI